MSRVVLYLDDNPNQLPTPAETRTLRKEHGIEAIAMQTTDPVAAVQKVEKDNVELAGALVDRCNREDLAHIRQLRLHWPGMLIGLLSARITDSDKFRAYRAGADVCILKGGSGAAKNSFCQRVADDFQGAKRRFRAELPKLLKDPANIGRWAAYTRDEQIGIGDSDLILIEKCERERRLSSRQFIVAQVVPELDALEETESWHSIAT